MRQPIRKQWNRLWRGPSELSPEGFWFYLATCFLGTLYTIRLYARDRDIDSLLFAVLVSGMLIHALWIAVRRRSRQQNR